MLFSVGRRLLHMIPVLLGITFLTFLIIDLAPGDYFAALRMNPAFSADFIHELELEFGYGEPLLVRYSRWLWRALHLDLGISLTFRVPVVDLLAARAGNTALLAVTSMVFSWLLAIPMGVWAALRPNTIIDRLMSFLAFLGMSVPNFFLAFLLLWVALETGWFPVGGTVSIHHESLDWSDKIIDRMAHLWLPTIVLGISGMASLMRLMRANILELKEAEFVRTARAKGLSETMVVGKHIMRNALNPFVTLAGYELGTLLSGAALVEAVMQLQGLGTLMLEAVRSLDTYVVMGSVLIGSILLLLGNLLADLALTWVDPRIDFSQRGQ
jgi:peptide/nickel transport system permease protein